MFECVYRLIPKVEKISMDCKICHTLFTVCPAAFLATTLSGTPTAAAIFCSAMDRRLNCDMRKPDGLQSAVLASMQSLTRALYLSEVRHPVRFAL